MRFNITLHFSTNAKQYTTCYIHNVRGCTYVGKSYDIKYTGIRDYMTTALAGAICLVQKISGE